MYKDPGSFPTPSALHCPPALEPFPEDTLKLSAAGVQAHRQVFLERSFLHPFWRESRRKSQDSYFQRTVGTVRRKGTVLAMGRSSWPEHVARSGAGPCCLQLSLLSRVRSPRGPRVPRVKRATAGLTPLPPSRLSTWPLRPQTLSHPRLISLPRPNPAMGESPLSSHLSPPIPPPPEPPLRPSFSTFLL